MTTKRANFIAELLRTGKTKSWPQYGEYLNENPEKVRKWWRQFRDVYVFEGKLDDQVKMSDLQIERVYELGILDEYQKEALLQPTAIFSEKEVENYEDKPSAWDSANNRYLTIEEYCSKYGLDVKTVKRSKLVGHNPNHMV